MQHVRASASGSFLTMGWRGGTEGGERHVDAVLLPSLTSREDDRARCVVDRPWRCPLLVERVGLAGPFDTRDPGDGGGRALVDSQLKLLPASILDISP